MSTSVPHPRRPLCPRLYELFSAWEAVSHAPLPSGPGCEVGLSEELDVLTRMVVAAERRITRLIPALQAQTPAGDDVRGRVTRAGMDSRRTRVLTQVAGYTQAHPVLGEAWHSGSVTLEQVDIVRQETHKLGHADASLVIETVLPVLPDLDTRATRHLVREAADHVAPTDPDDEERRDYAKRSLNWARVPGGGGIVFEGYLPTLEGGAFTAAVDAIVEAQRTEGDTRLPSQRRADALAELVSRASAHGLPTGGGLPAAVTVTVSLTEAERVALLEPAAPRARRRRPKGRSTCAGEPATDAVVRFGLCAADITPLLHVPVRPTGETGATAATATATRTDSSLTPDAERASAQAPFPEPRTPSQGETWKPPARSPHSLLDRITHTPTEPLALGRAVRLATSGQRRVLKQRDQGCVIPGCDIPAPYTQPHHIQGWALHGATDTSNLVSLCWAHHRATELGHYRITPRTPEGERPEGALAHPHWWITPQTPRRR